MNGGEIERVSAEPVSPSRVMIDQLKTEYIHRFIYLYTLVTVIYIFILCGVIII
jgi:hypothetical protein